MTEQAVRDKPALDPEMLKAALGRFVTGVTIITTCGRDGAPIGVTANSFNSVSMEPPLVLFSLDRRAFSLSAFTWSRRFAVNILSAEQAQLSDRFATPLADKWSRVDWRPGRNGCPLIEGTLSRLECTTRHIYEGGDHLIFVGQVTALDVTAGGAPLIYDRGRYRRLAGPEPE